MAGCNKPSSPTYKKTGKFLIKRAPTFKQGHGSQPSSYSVTTLSSAFHHSAFPTKENFTLSSTYIFLEGRTGTAWEPSYLIIYLIFLPMKNQHSSRHTPGHSVFITVTISCSSSRWVSIFQLRTHLVTEDPFHLHKWVVKYHLSTFLKHSYNQIVGVLFDSTAGLMLHEAM